MNGLYTPGRIRTFTGKFVDPFNLEPEDISIEDIAHSLAHQCRFAGHTQCFYSVAEHCLNVELQLRGDLSIYGLLHDASEAYLIDLPTPIKCQLPEYKAAEERAMRAVALRFGLDFELFQDERLKEADKKMLEHEYAQLVLDYRQGAFDPIAAKWKFMERFEELKWTVRDNYNF